MMSIGTPATMTDPAITPASNLPPAAARRNPMLDASRLIAALAILMMHTLESAHFPRQGEVGRFATPFFIVAAIYLLTVSMRRNWDRPFLPYAWQRFIRLYVPFLGWGVLSGLAMLLKHRFVSGSPIAPLGWSDLLTGRSFQLWFLPFLFLVCLVMFWVCRWVAPATQPVKTAVAAGAIVLGLTAPYVPMPFSNELARTSYAYFTGLSWESLSPVLFGLALALLPPRWVPTSAWQAVIGLAFTIASMCFVVKYGRNLLLESLAGTAFMIFALANWRSPVVVALARFPFLIYGIYLSQGIVLETVQTALGRAHVSPSLMFEVAVFFLTACLCILLCFGLNKSSITRWLLGS